MFCMRGKACTQRKEIDKSPSKTFLGVKMKHTILQQMCQAVGTYQKKLQVNAVGKIDPNELLQIFQRKYAAFYPNLLEISIVAYDAGTGKILYVFEFTYRIGQVKLNMMEQEVTREVARVANMLFLPDMPPEAKIYLVHNYLASTVEYQQKNSNALDTSYTQSAYGALIKHRCVCQGYAEAFQRFMDFAGIPSFIVAGKVKGFTDNHAWNIVSPGPGKGYYHVDVTWDAADGVPRFTYFCKNDGFIRRERDWDEEVYPACTGSYPVLSMARKYVMQHKAELIAQGTD